MRDFATLQNATQLIRHGQALFGTIYYSTNDRGLPLLMVRHFDHDASPATARTFADINKASGDWIGRHGLSDLIRIEPVSEIGTDFIVRPFHVYTTSLRSYVEDSHPPSPPEELQPMRDRLRAQVGKSLEAKDVIVERVLARSLLEPSGK